MIKRIWGLCLLVIMDVQSDITTSCLQKRKYQSYKINQLSIQLNWLKNNSCNCHVESVHVSTVYESSNENVVKFFLNV